ncbi:MAG: indolepyruvate oxidoreductase subunit beta family protein [Rubrivivax sp.]
MDPPAQPERPEPSEPHQGPEGPAGQAAHGGAATEPLTLLICALGGEGGGRLTQWIVEASRQAGHPAQATSVPGVAQRTGSTTYYVEVWPQPESELDGRQPVFCLSPVPGALDGLLASELLEGARAIAQGYTSAERTLVIGSVSRTLTTIERMQPGDGRLEGQLLEKLVATCSRAHHLLDMAALARECGTALSAVMLGALAGSRLLPFARSHFEAAVRADGADVTASLLGFARAFDLVQSSSAPAPAPLATPAPEPTPVTAAAPGLPEPWRTRLPSAAHALAALGVQRVREYQDEAYAQRYLQRLARIAQAEQAAPGGRAGGTAAREKPGEGRVEGLGEGPDEGPGAVTAETARWLALWMAFDDVLRVADLKSRASRWVRVAREVRAGPEDVLKVYEHFKPGAPELAGLLPPGLARRLLAWDARRVARGQDPFALPLKLPTHTVSGLLALRALAALKRWRPLGSRFALEQSLIERWLAAVQAGLARDRWLGLERARCGQLVKGYGSTNERGKDNMMHLLVHLSQAGEARAAAAAVRTAREAALADDSGRALDQALVARGAPARPVKEQPIRFVRRRPAPGTAPE